MTVTRGEVGGGHRGKRVNGFRNMYKGLMDKTKDRWNQGKEVGMVRWGECWRVNADNCTLTTMKQLNKK